MDKKVCVIGAGLAGSEAALQLARHDIKVALIEARPVSPTPVHKTDYCAELVCSNSLKSEKEDSAAGLLKHELKELNSIVFSAALQHRVPAGGALAVERDAFAKEVTHLIETSEGIELIRQEVVSINNNACIELSNGEVLGPFNAFVVASGPLTSDTFASWLMNRTGCESLSFYDAAAPIVYADSLNMDKVFRQSRYEEGEGDYLNAAFNKEEYELFINELLSAKRVISKEFETKELFQACQPIEEIARKGFDAPRFGPLKPVGLTDPSTGRRPWAAVQLRAEDKYGQSYNLVGFQTNLTFPEQERVFRMIPGLETAEFSRYGVMHRNTFLDAPRLMSSSQEVKSMSQVCSAPVFLAGQIAGTEGYCEAIRSGLHASLSIIQLFNGESIRPLPAETVYGALLAYATDPAVSDYQPMHVNFGILPPLTETIKNKGQRYAAYAKRSRLAIQSYVASFEDGL